MVVTKPFYSLTREVVKSPCVKIPKGCLDTVLGSLLSVALREHGFGPRDLWSSFPILFLTLYAENCFTFPSVFSLFPVSCCLLSHELSFH